MATWIDGGPQAMIPRMIRLSHADNEAAIAGSCPEVDQFADEGSNVSVAAPTQ